MSFMGNFSLPTRGPSFKPYTRLPMELRHSIIAAYLSQAGMNFVSVEPRDKEWDWDRVTTQRDTTAQDTDYTAIAVKSDIEAHRRVLESDLVPTASYTQADISNSVSLQAKMQAMRSVGHEQKSYISDLSARPGVLRFQLPGRNDIISLAASDDVSFVEYLPAELYASDRTLDCVIQCPVLEKIRRVAVRFCHEWRPACDLSCPEFGEANHVHEQVYPTHLMQFLGRCFPNLEQVWLVDYHATAKRGKTGDEMEELADMLSAMKVDENDTDMDHFDDSLQYDDDMDQDDDKHSTSSSSSFNDSGFFEASDLGSFRETEDAMDTDDDEQDAFSDAMEYLEDMELDEDDMDMDGDDVFTSAMEGIEGHGCNAPDDVGEIIEGFSILRIDQQTTKPQGGCPRRVFHAQGRRYHEVRRDNNDWNISPKAQQMCDWLQQNFVHYAKHSPMACVRDAETVEFGLLACQWEIEAPWSPQSSALRQYSRAQGCNRRRVSPHHVRDPNAMDWDPVHLFGSGSLDGYHFGFPQGFMDADAKSPVMGSSANETWGALCAGV